MDDDACKVCTEVLKKFFEGIKSIVDGQMDHAFIYTDNRIVKMPSIDDDAGFGSVYPLNFDLLNCQHFHHWGKLIPLWRSVFDDKVNVHTHAPAFFGVGSDGVDFGKATMVKIVLITIIDSL